MRTLQSLLVFTGNPGKVREIDALLSGRVSLRTPAELSTPLPDVDEVGETFEANAILKAVAAARVAGMPTLADDSGLEVDALGGDPGVRSARFAVDAGRCATDAPRIEQTRANNAHLLERLEGVATEDRSARFRCAVCLAMPVESAPPVPESLPDVHVSPPPAGLEEGWSIVVAHGRTEGRVLDALRGAEGFGYDPLFWSFDLERSFAEATRDAKGAVSHRGRALDAVASYLHAGGLL